MCQVGHLDPSSHQRVLMKTGLILLIIGHLNFIAGGLVHGIVLRFVVDPQDPISLLYGVTNVTSAVAALLVSLQVVPVETPSSGQCLGLLRLDSVETAQL
ncbi:PREDICTED: transmembrane protein 54 [Chaetura pelagica]|uniref:transmembrane protein 54 n=1 Tax=Chaetura pelagica TaxID=8897 RepID=UPI00052314E6|nr:PREDICTED: transmembrane protein 54 [Chaetura pelagica]